MAEKPSANQRNRILDRLSPADFGILAPRLQPVQLKFRERLQTVNRPLEAVFFPESGFATAMATSQGSCRQSEVAIVGREGMTGLPVVLGADQSPWDVLMQVAGYGQRISAGDLRAAMDRSVTLRGSFLRFAHVSAVQCGHTALANAQGKINERLARWLLMAHDRIDGDALELTHDTLSLMLGTRRAGVSTAIGQFEQKGVIETRRRAIIVRDRRGLEQCANGLYGAPEAEFERLFGVKDRSLPLGTSEAGS
jgi:hypothetical protein